MRGLSIMLACAAGVLANQDCLAGIFPDRFDLERRNTTTEQFHQDLNICVAQVVERGAIQAMRICQKSFAPVLQRDPGPIYSDTGGVSENKITTEICADRFILDCMRAKGYVRVPESKGFPVDLRWKFPESTENVELRWN